MTVWLVRSGKYGERETLALESGLAVIGWDDMPDLSKLRTRDDLNTALASTYPDEKGKTLSNWESQLWPFAHMMAKDDIIVMPLKSRAAIALGRVTGPYHYRTDLNDAHHTRLVEWAKEVPRSAFAQDLLYSFGAFLTVCRIHRNDAETRIAAVLNGKIDPAISSRNVASVGEGKGVKDAKEGVITADDTSAAVDLMEVADDAIRMKIATVFKGHRLSTLVGAVLETQGYKVVVSPPGADGGVDIVAGKGPLGFDEPRLVVQVKSQDAAVDVSVLRELQGVMRQFSAEQGLLVAWGGVTKALAKEAQRLFFEIRIWDAGEIVKAVQQSYEHLSEEVQADLPLKRIWVLADHE
ncbi:restriction endonuclease [Asticcacaulis sp. DXS10W]|uniref:Restriction endonuclease n=1 Tax=Asticcacaulis currens TaxID=2984210 RepID=A0ABT5IEI1_9CAUL|nr:restriction endonuclease [Asticcacaulis currens]MDC7693866.1 restriction endonuclease [Asticcacaulis currens]